MCSSEHDHVITHTHEHGGHTHEHTHTVSHTHTHADGTTHSHSHTAASSPEEALALLKYMLGHNRHHAEELHELAHCFEDEAVHDLIHDAVEEMNDANALIEQAVSLIENAGA